MEKAQRVQIGQAVRQRRTALKKSQAEIARAADIDVRTVGDIERADGDGWRSIATATQLGLAEALGFEPDWVERVLAGQAQPVAVGEDEPDLRRMLDELRERLLVVEARLGIEPRDERTKNNPGSEPVDRRPGGRKRDERLSAQREARAGAGRPGGRSGRIA